MNIRPATAADVPRIAAIVLASATAEEPWSSYIPTAARQNIAFVAAVEKLVKEYVEADDNQWTVQVAETGRNGSVATVAAVAIWDMRAAPAVARRLSSRANKDLSQKPQKLSTTRPICSDNWSIDPENSNLDTLNRAFTQCRQRFFATNGPQIALRLLVTSPNYQRSGYAKALCKSGLEMGWERQATVFLQTGARGYIAVSGMGFSEVGSITIPAAKGQDEQVLKALRMDITKAQESHPSMFSSLWNYVRN